MLNEFLTQLLQVIIALDVVGVIAWFILGARRRSEASTATVTPATTAVQADTPSAWQKLTGRRPAPVAARTGGIDQAFGQLRRVLDSYSNGLA